MFFFKELSIAPSEFVVIPVVSSNTWLGGSFGEPTVSLFHIVLDIAVTFLHPICISNVACCELPFNTTLPRCRFHGGRRGRGGAQRCWAVSLGRERWAYIHKLQSVPESQAQWLIMGTVVERIVEVFDVIVSPAKTQTVRSNNVLLLNENVQQQSVENEDIQQRSIQPEEICM